MNKLLRSRAGRHIVVPALAAGLLAAGGAGVAVAATAGATAPAAGPAATGMLAAGQTGTRSAVPWRKVGQGWTLAEYSRTQSVYANHRRIGPTYLYLVDPAGGRYRLYRWARQAPGLADWSGDKARALFFTDRGLEQITLASGRVTRIKIPQAAQALGYTRPEGTNILAIRGYGKTQRILRYNLRGQLQKVLASTMSDGGAIDSPDGTAVVVSAAKGLRYISNTGRQIRSLRAGAGHGCWPVRWWSSSTVLATCSQANGRDRLWLAPVSGHDVRALTPRRTGAGADPMGDLNGWRLPSGLYLQAPTGCASEQIAKQQRDGKVTVVKVPHATGNDNHVLAARDGRLLVLAETGCEGSNSLLWFNPANHHEQWLLRAPVKLQGVVAAVPFYSRPGPQ